MDAGFCRYDLRTTEPEAARGFYQNALGLELGPMLGVGKLAEQARARGAPPHWLGSLAVRELEPVVQALLDRGSQLLGASERGEEHEAFAVIRDPCGAIVAVRESAPIATRAPIVWHQLHTADLDRSCALYSELFGWSIARTIETARPEGKHWIIRLADREIGSLSSIAGRPGVHPHWLFYFAVADLERRLADVSANGGRPLAPIALPNGDRVAACEDPQGAAFGLFQAA